MATQIDKAVLYIRKGALWKSDAGLTDAQLLGLFIESRDEGALAALVHRHASMIWGVCRRILPNHQDAEDAFPATFLVLAQNDVDQPQRDGGQLAVRSGPSDRTEGKGNDGHASQQGTAVANDAGKANSRKRCRLGPAIAGRSGIESPAGKIPSRDRPL